MRDERSASGDYRRLFLVAPQPLLVCGAQDFTVLDANEAAVEILGGTSDDLIGTSFSEWVADHDREDLVSVLRQRHDGELAWGPWSFRSPEGLFTAQVVLTDVTFEQADAVLAMVIDITGRLERERRLRESEQRYAIAVRGANDGIWDWDLVTDTVYYSPRFCELLGYQDGEFGDRPESWFEKVHPEDLDQLRLEIDLHLRMVTPRLKVEYRVRHREGHYVWMLTRGVAVMEDGRPLRMAGSQTDISDRRADEERILQGAFYDRLTGLANRSLFLDRLGFLLRRARKSEDYGFTVLFLDLDRFKMVNESYGHVAGDTVLGEVGSRFSQAVGTGDTLARLGGDEFGVILDGVSDVATAIHHAQALLDTFQGPFDVLGDEVMLGVSIGVAVNDGRYERSDDLLRDADTAMYRAKEKGRSRYEVFDQEMHEEAVALLRDEMDLRRGIAAAEFELFYQPIISLSDGSIAGSEALVRWRHPDRGLVMPGAFIPLAEESGLIVPLGEWIMNEACRQCHEWIIAGLSPGSVSVNLSAHQFKSGLVQELIGSALERHDLKGRHLHVELTESAVMYDPEQAIAIFRQLETLGVRFVVDDFGTGYSSLSHLKRFRFGSLKIDRSFVQDVATDAENAALVAAVIALAHSFRAQCVGEGVETTDQLSYLRLLKCDLAQGYLFSRPVPALEFEEMLRSGVKGWHRLLFQGQD